LISCEKSDDAKVTPHYGTYTCVMVETNGVKADAKAEGFDVVLTFHEDGSYEEYYDGRDNYGSSFEYDKSSKSLIFRYDKDDYGMFSGAGKGDIKVKTWTDKKLVLSFTGYDEGMELKTVLTFEK